MSDNNKKKSKSKKSQGEKGDGERAPVKDETAKITGEHYDHSVTKDKTESKDKTLGPDGSNAEATTSMIYKRLGPDGSNAEATTLPDTQGPEKDNRSSDTVAKDTGKDTTSGDTEPTNSGTYTTKDTGKDTTSHDTEPPKSGTDPTKDTEKDMTSGDTKPTNSGTDTTKAATATLSQADDESEDEGIDDITSTEDMDRSARDALYDRGLQYEVKNKKKPALKCYLQCLKGLNDVTKFSFLPQCLRKVADIYFEKEEFEKAIQFIQAEKMYYETALIDTSELEKKLEVRKKTQTTTEGSSNVDPKVATPEIVRADEYENLARLCLEQKQPQLALEYQGKATKIRQQVYGENHPVTTQSLDFFTVIYGEVGKQQYSESMEKIKTTSKNEKDGEDTKSDTSLQESPQSILRRRKKSTDPSENKEDKKKQVRFAEAMAAREEEEWISRAILTILVIFMFLALFVASFYVYCKMYPSSGTCVTWKTEIYYNYMRIKYLYHYYFASQPDQVVG